MDTVGCSFCAYIVPWSVLRCKTVLREVNVNEHGIYFYVCSHTKALSTFSQARKDVATLLEAWYTIAAALDGCVIFTALCTNLAAVSVADWAP
jgi:hypothetical protein